MACDEVVNILEQNLQDKCVYRREDKAKLCGAVHRGFSEILERSLERV